MTRSTVETVLAWHAALNAGDVDGLLSLTTQDVEVGGPRGVGQGPEVLRDWVARTGIRLETGRVFGRGEIIVIEQGASWLSDDGKMTAPQTVASVIRTRDGRVSSVIRYPDLVSALHAAGLAGAEEHGQLPGRGACT